METDDTPLGGEIIDAIKAAGVRHVAALPDIVTSGGILRPLSEDPDIRLIRLCKEDEGVSICAGLSYCEKRAVLLMQQTGLMDSLNSVRATGVEYGLPICMVVGLLGKEPDRPASESENYGVRIVEPVLDAMGIDRLGIETSSDVALLAPAIDRAYAESRPVVALIGRRIER